MACLAAGMAPAQERVWALQLNALKDSDKKPLAPRKHFYLLYNPDTKAPALKKETFFKNLVAAVGPPPTMQTYQAALVKSGLTEAKAKEFIDNWLLRYRCETIYCLDITPDDLTRISLFKEVHNANAPLFAKASDAGPRAFRWLPNFLPEAVRTGYYDARRKWVNCAQSYLTAAPAQNGLGLMVKQAMTNEQGVTYFPNFPAGNYFVTNLLPLEAGPDLSKLTTNLWFFNKEIKATTPGGKTNVYDGSGDKGKIDVKDLQSAAAPTFKCE